MANRVHRPLKVIAFNVNGILRQRYELSKQLQDLHIDVALFSETHLKPHQRFHIQNYHLYRNDRHPGIKGGTAVAVKKGIPHSPVDLPPLISVEARGVSRWYINTIITVHSAQFYRVVRTSQETHYVSATSPTG
jgi:exonuclease III